MQWIYGFLLTQHPQSLRLKEVPVTGGMKANKSTAQ
jgi:hypothetical protein